MINDPLLPSPPNLRPDGYCYMHYALCSPLTQLVLVISIDNLHCKQGSLYATSFYNFLWYYSCLVRYFFTCTKMLAPFPGSPRARMKNRRKFRTGSDGNGKLGGAWEQGYQDVFALFPAGHWQCAHANRHQVLPGVWWGESCL